MTISFPFLQRGPPFPLPPAPTPLLQPQLVTLTRNVAAASAGHPDQERVYREEFYQYLPPSLGYSQQPAHHHRQQQIHHQGENFLSDEQQPDKLLMMSALGAPTKNSLYPGIPKNGVPGSSHQAFVGPSTAPPYSYSCAVPDAWQSGSARTSFSAPFYPRRAGAVPS